MIDTLGTAILPNTAKKAVLLYDTEQSEVQLYKNIAGLLKRGKLTTMPDYFKAHCLTSMSRKERMQAIVQSMDRFYYRFGGIQMVVIDGIADLVRCANDEAESIGIIDELYRLAGIKLRRFVWFGLECVEKNFHLLVCYFLKKVYLCKKFWNILLNAEI